ncbi:MAG TPA: hypothetical protein VGR37_12595 [Longimicrobiaceae bacterium]|nr:hypothetical protein [Longimicrobiaceae bacterium]
MKATPARLALLLVLPCVLLAAGCGRGGEGDAAADAAAVDTTNPGALDGLSAEQIEARAQPLTPEEAARLGMIVDTSIHLESMQSPEDSALADRVERSRREAAAAPDTTAAPPPE